MKKCCLFCLAVLMCAASISFAEDRTVLYEHFSEDLCLYCPAVAAAIADFRSHYDREQVAIISYLVHGEDAVNFGVDRLDFYGEEAVPIVAGDGLDNLGPMPIDESVLINHYNSRHNTPSNLEMEVFQESNTQYRIHIEAETAINASLMAVAYEDVYHGAEADHYPCFARQFLTEYYGDPISLSAGEERDIVKTVTLQGSWNPANMGVVAWIQVASKSGRAFRAHESMQAADSRAPHVNPTPTPPEPTNTPNPEATSTPPPEGTPTPTPTFSQSALEQHLDLSHDMFHSGDDFRLDVQTHNPASNAVNVDQYIVLDVAGMYFFWDNWTAQPQSLPRTYAAGYNGEENILNFTWPTVDGSYSGIRFWLASLRSGTSELAGAYDMKEFGYE
jgi:hypothetical protein